MPFESFGRVFNLSGEIVAEGSCQIDYDSGRITMHPIYEAPLLTRQDGDMRLVLDEGGEVMIKKDVIRFRLNVAGSAPGPSYRMFIANGGLREVGGS